MNTEATNYPDDVNPNAPIHALATNEATLMQDPQNSQNAIIGALERSASLDKLMMNTILIAFGLLEKLQLPISHVELLDKMLRGKQSPQAFIEAAVRTIHSTGSQANFTKALEEAYTRFPHLRPVI
jgi:hypothetical protein